MLTDLNLTDPALALQLLALQRLAYTQEAELIGYPDLPPLKETLAELMRCQERILAWCEGGQLLAALGYEQEEDGYLICRLVVHPAAQRRGLARALLQAVTQAVGPAVLRVGTAAANRPALALYEQHGFVRQRLLQTPDGLALVLLQYLPEAVSQPDSTPR